jgi:hypothetical protein
MANIFFGLEKRLQNLVEGLADLFPDRNPVHELIHKLIDCMQTNESVDEEHHTYAPGKYRIYLSSEEESILRQRKDWIQELETAIKQVALENDLAFLEPLHFEIIKRNRQSESIRVECEQTSDVVEDTAVMASIAKATHPQRMNTFLLVNGKSTFPILEPVINIGRRSDNHLVIDDPRVSRLHAQLRINAGEVILFDLDSTGGTFVNNRRIDKAVLHPGDVISLAGFPMIYGEEISTQNGSSIENENPTQLPPSGEK